MVSPVSERVRWPPTAQQQHQTIQQEENTMLHTDVVKSVSEADTTVNKNVVHSEPVRNVTELAVPVVNNQVSKLIC